MKRQKRAKKRKKFEQLQAAARRDWLGAQTNQVAVFWAELIAFFFYFYCFRIEHSMTLHACNGCCVCMICVFNKAFPIHITLTHTQTHSYAHIHSMAGHILHSIVSIACIWCVLFLVFLSLSLSINRYCCSIFFHSTSYQSVSGSLHSLYLFSLKCIFLFLIILWHIVRGYLFSIAIIITRQCNFFFPLNTCFVCAHLFMCMYT